MFYVLVALRYSGPALLFLPFISIWLKQLPTFSLGVFFVCLFVCENWVGQIYGRVESPMYAIVILTEV